MGCILSVAAAWVSREDGIEEYYQLRKSEAKTAPNLEDPSHHGCFHDGTKPLKAVATMHQRIIEHGCDAVTAEVIDFISSHCIVELKDRRTARYIHDSLNN